MRRGLDFAQAELATKVRGKYLRALEEEQFDLLPAQTYVKGFLRTYAEYLGLDGQLYVDEYNSRFVGTADEHEPRTRRSAARPQHRHRRSETNVVLVVLAAIAVLMIVIFAAWKASDNNSPTAPPAKHRTARRPAAPAPLLTLTGLRGSTHVAARVGSASGNVAFDGTISKGDSARRSPRTASLAADRLAGEPAHSGSRQARARPGAEAARDHRHVHRLAPRVRAAIVASGSELVRGDRQDRNGPYLAGSLLRLGIDPVRITVVGDEPAELEAALRAGLDEDLLVVSGGLGPTHDDRTIELLAAATGRPLAVDEELASKIEARSRRVGRTPGPSLRRLRGGRAQAGRATGRGGVGGARRHRTGRGRRHGHGGRRCAPGAAARAAGALASGARDRAAARPARTRAGSGAAGPAAVRRVGVRGRASRSRPPGAREKASL